MFSFLQETRRQAAVEAANRRFQQSENRGVDEDELRRLKQRQIEQQRIEEQHKKLQSNNNNTGGGGLRVSLIKYFFVIFIF